MAGRLNVAAGDAGNFLTPVENHVAGRVVRGQRGAQVRPRDGRLENLVPFGGQSRDELTDVLEDRGGGRRRRGA